MKKLAAELLFVLVLVLSMLITYQCGTM